MRKRRSSASESIRRKGIEVRKLNPFELSAVKRLRDGEQLLSKKSNDEMLVVGALRATSSCHQCHNSSDGELLGAFAYRFRKHDEVGMPNANR